MNLPPEAVWGYDTVTSAYRETPEESRKRIVEQIRRQYPEATEEHIKKIVG